MKCKLCNESFEKKGKQKFCSEACRKKSKYESSKRYIKKNPDKNREKTIRWRTKYPERYSKTVRNWQQNNPNWNEQQRMRYHNRKSGLLREIWKSQNCSCNICGIVLLESEICQDHKEPLSKGGSNNRDNIQVLCRKCNSSKGDRID